MCYLLDSIIISRIWIPFSLFAIVLTVQSTPEASNAEGDRKEEEAGWVEREMNAIDCGAQFAMLKSIKLHGGKTVLNTIKAIKTGKRQIYK